jgi:hypothetical protein
MREVHAVEAILASNFEGLVSKFILYARNRPSSEPPLVATLYRNTVKLPHLFCPGSRSGLVRAWFGAENAGIVVSGATMPLEFLRVSTQRVGLA